jgi:hypothetical protein
VHDWDSGSDSWDIVENLGPKEYYGTRTTNPICPTCDSELEIIWAAYVHVLGKGEEDYDGVVIDCIRVITPGDKVEP